MTASNHSIATGYFRRTEECKPYGVWYTAIVVVVDDTGTPTTWVQMTSGQWAISRNSSDPIVWEKPS